MRKINIDFFENFEKNKMDNNYFDLWEEELGFKFGEKHRNYLIRNSGDYLYGENFKNYYLKKGRLTPNGIYSSKYLKEKITKDFYIKGFFTPNTPYKNYKKKTIKIDESIMSLCGLIETDDNFEYDILITIGLKNTEIEDQLYVSYDNENISYLCKNIDEFFDSLVDENGTKIRFITPEETIKEAEKEINKRTFNKEEILFPDSYKKFLLETAGGLMHSPAIINKKINIEINYKIHKFYNKYSPKDKYSNTDYMLEYFVLGELLDYWDLFRGDWRSYEEKGINFQAICEAKIIPIALYPHNGVFFVGSKGSKNENKVFFYDYGLADDDQEYDPDSLDCICDSFDEYINSFYLEFEDENEGDDFEYYLKSNVRYYFPMPFKYSLTSNSFTESINDDEFEKIPDNY